MSIIRVLAVEDDEIHEERLRMILDKLGYNLIDVMNATNGFMAKVVATQPDVLLIDIDLGEAITGIDLAKKVNEIRDIPIVYLTCFTDHDTFSRAKKTMPEAYITKPYKQEELQRAIELAVNKQHFSPTSLTSEKRATTYKSALFLKENNGLVKVTVDDILLVEAFDKYCYIYTSEKKYMLKVRLKDVLEQLPPDLFCQVHRSYLININAIEQILPKTNKVLVLKHEIPIGKSFKNDFFSRIQSLG